MSFLLSRNPVWAAIRALVGLGLLAYGLLGFSAVSSGTAAAITPGAYLSLPQCPDNPIPTNGACYSVRPGTVLGRRQQLTTYWVTISDGRTSREVELANGNRFDTFQPGTAVAVKYWKGSVTAVGVPVAGDASALTSTVDSPLGHDDALGHSLRYMGAGLIGLLLGGLPLLLHLSRRSPRAATGHGAAAHSPDDAAVAQPALYSPPVPVAAPLTAIPPLGRAADPAGAPGLAASQPAAGASGSNFVVSTAPTPAGPRFAAPAAAGLRPSDGSHPEAQDLPVSTPYVAVAPSGTPVGPGPPVLHQFVAPAAPAPAGRVVPQYQPTFTVLGAPSPTAPAPHPEPVSPAIEMFPPVEAAHFVGPPAPPRDHGDDAGAEPAPPPRPRWTPTPAASIHFPTPVAPPRVVTQQGGGRLAHPVPPMQGVPLAAGVPLAHAVSLGHAIPLAVVPPTPTQGAPSHSGPVTDAAASSAPSPGPAFSVLPYAPAEPGSSPSADPVAPALSQPCPPPSTSENGGGPGWSVRQGPGPGPRQAG